jgi:hypothetical protein
MRGNYSICEASLSLLCFSTECWCRFYKGCSTFLPVFDSQYDTFDSLHERSPFAVNAICMVASQVRDGGGTSLAF